MTKHDFAIADDFLLDGKPFKIISGGIHYFRVVPEYWTDRLEKLKAMGCNTVETYVPWNMHEPRKGTFDFTGILDIVSFIRRAQELGLWVIVRPSPYICAEWEWGGLPAWLLADDSLRIRSTDPAFLRHVEEYWRVLLPLLTPLQCTEGGPVILMQIENEYGYYGNDTAYMEALRDCMRSLGVTVPLVTSDGPNGDALACGSVPGAHPTANYGSRAAEQMPKLERHLSLLGGGPQMVMEFWVGWFDYWGGERHRAKPEDNARDLDEILRRGSVNFYMFHGGTDFGFMNGSNYYGRLTPDVTSYDYDAPLAEDGTETEKYHALREVIRRHAPVPEVKLSTPIKRKAFGGFPVTGRAGLFESLTRISAPVESSETRCMEKLGQNYGYVLYQSRVDAGDRLVTFQLAGANDRAQVFVDGKQELCLYDQELLPPHKVDWKIRDGGLRLDILVENMGRVNYGYLLPRQRKGIDGGVLCSASEANQPRYHFGWKQWPLPMDGDSLARLDFTAGWDGTGPGFHRVEFDVDEPVDTHLDMAGWGKGFVALNGFNIGRFWEIGPQRTLYIPAPLLRKGRNSLIIFESEGKTPGVATFIDKPLLG